MADEIEEAAVPGAADRGTTAGMEGLEKGARMGKDAIGEVTSYVSRGTRADLPEEVRRKAKHHILDTFAAMVSGSTFKPGRLAMAYARRQAGAREAQVVGSRALTSAINAAFVNGIMAHADETDDSHEKSLTHPGCAIVPAALAVAEKEGADGLGFLKGVVVGYDIGCRITQVLGPAELMRRHLCSHSIGGNFGAAAAAAAICGLPEDRVGYVLSYAGHQASGVTYWMRDAEHVQKAFVFGGMPARDGATAAILAQSGFTGVSDPFSGQNNFLEAFSGSPEAGRLSAGLGSTYEIMATNIKKFAVGSPIQAPLEALLLLMGAHRFRPADVDTIVVSLPTAGAQRTVVDNRDMPDVNLQYILAVALLDGDLSFSAAHSYERMREPAVLDTEKRITVREDPGLNASKTARQAIVEVRTKDGAVLSEHVTSVRGTAENPMTTEEVERKSRELLVPVLGEDRARQLIERVWHLEEVKNVRELRPLMSKA